ncbi:hypothetical protein NDU88_004699 [Pleurodeles waltl]|uniref:Uncharacterized protein n=1 Tax=Pleurodeles waltl TaxID=8319 RepID=A0AAV7MUM4_PLEWA|nr:hypothetical protein NDU88_004699 [Pleurodeles waltl]
MRRRAVVKAANTTNPRLRDSKGKGLITRQKRWLNERGASVFSHFQSSLGTDTAEDLPRRGTWEVGNR